jgi:hypothetical protein
VIAPHNLLDYYDYPSWRGSGISWRMNDNAHNKIPGPDDHGLPWESRFHALAETLAESGGGILDRNRFARQPEGYGRAVLYRDDAAEIVAILWPAGIASSLHGHGDSSVLLQLITGEVVEDRFLRSGDGLDYRSVSLSAGQASRLPVGALHRVVAVEESLGLHAYTPHLIEPAVPPADADHARIIAAWQRSEAARRGEPLPDYLVDYLKGSTP